MALTVNIAYTFDIGQTEKLYVGSLDFDSSYPTGGEAIDTSTNESFKSAVFGHKGGYTFSLDVANQKVIAYYVDNNAASDSAQIEVPNTTDLSAVTGVTIWAIGA